MLLNYFYAFVSSFWGGSFSNLIIAIVDVALVYFFIYRFFVLIKGTKSAQILFGFFMILMLFFLGNMIKMRATVWLLEGFFEYFIIMAIIIFHGEIRAILSSFELFEFFKKSGSEFDAYFVVEELVESLFYLAGVREGALVLVTQKGDPSVFVTGGVSLDANVKKELILSIFRKDSPLHDGAVIIKNGKIQKAGVVLPLSTNPDIDPNFGTRHRAAYGISEQVDSIVFVVSEERGQISMLLNGLITRNMTKDMVKKVLKKYLKEV